MKGIQKEGPKDRSGYCPVKLIDHPFSEIIPSCFLFLSFYQKLSDKPLIWIITWDLQRTAMVYGTNWIVQKVDEPFKWAFTSKLNGLELSIDGLQKCFPPKVNGPGLKQTVGGEWTVQIMRANGLKLVLDRVSLDRLLSLNTVHFHHNPKYTVHSTFVIGHMYNSQACLLDDIIGKDQSDFSFEWNSLWKWWIEFILFIKIAQRNKKSFLQLLESKSALFNIFNRPFLKTWPGPNEPVL